MTRGAVVVAALLLAACGPSLTQVRRYLASSPHRRVSVFPFDCGPDRADFGRAFAGSFQNKLRGDGFIVADRGKTEKVYFVSELSKGGYDAVKDAASFASALGVQAALVGRVEAARERLDQTPAVYNEEPGNHRRILARAARSVRLSYLAVRLRLIDAATARVLWETSYSAELTGNLNNVSDAVGNILSDQLADAYLQQRF